MSLTIDERRLGSRLDAAVISLNIDEKAGGSDMALEIPALPPEEATVPVI